MKRMATSITFLLMLCFMTRSLGPLTEELANLAALVLFTLFIFMYCPPRAKIGIIKWLPLVVGFVVLAVIVSRIPDEIGRLVGISAVVVLLELVHRLLGKGTGELPIFALTSLLCSLTLFIISYMPEAWWLTQEWSTTISGFVVGFWHRGFILGSTAFGSFILCSFGTLYLSTFLFSQKRKATTLVILLLSVLGAEIILLVTYPFISSLITHFRPQIPADKHYLQSILFLLLLAPTYLNFRNIEFREIPVNVPRASLMQITFGALAFLLFGGLLSTSLMTADKGKITFYEKGLLDWRVPVFGVYGQQGSGRFGLLPTYLEAKGYDTARTPTITEENLAQSDVLVMINLMEAISDKEKESIWKYVSEGGSLLLLGDHTNVGGLMNIFNDILEPVPIRFRFDSVMPGRYGWRDSLDFLPHPITYGLEDETDVQFWVGASLDCRPPSSPVIMGRYAFSDTGNPQNVQRAFLGNSRLDPGEQLGDLVLAAESRYGKGKVLVFGDTSSFQNISLSTADKFVDGVFHWLVSKEIPGRETPLTIVALMSLVLAALFLTRPGWSLMTLLICVVVVSMSITIPRIAQGAEPEEETKAEVAYIDYSHTGRFDLMYWEDDSIGGLSNNLLRNGFMPFLLRDFSKEKLSQAKLLVLIAPAKPFQKREIGEIKAFVERGGTLLISVGWEEEQAIAPLLESMGLYLDNIPLGPVELKRGNHTVRFREAWPIFYRDGGTKAVVQQWNYPIVTEQVHGKGRIIAIGDSYFLLNQNLEGIEEYSLGNIFLLRDILSGGGSR
ncbi:DUF4350 domain-containing protein [Chloroflexota bacterium]